MKTRRWAMGSGVVVLGALASGMVAFRASGAGQNSDLSDKMVNDPTVPVLGNPMARITMVEFFDYRCPYCRTMQPVLHELMTEHKDVRLLAREWPIFGGVSIFAARVALASNWQGKFPAVHAALFALGRGMDEPTVRQAAASAQIDMVRLDHDLAARKGELDTALGDTAVMAHALGFQGTPGFIVGHFKAPGALTLRQLDDMIVQSARQG